MAAYLVHSTTDKTDRLVIHFPGTLDEVVAYCREELQKAPPFYDVMDVSNLSSPDPLIICRNTATEAPRQNQEPIHQQAEQPDENPGDPDLEDTEESDDLFESGGLY